jgi:hypothetical protein
MFFYSLGESLRIAYDSQRLDLDSSLRGMSNPSWTKQPEDGPIKKIIARHCKLAFKSLSDALGLSPGLRQRVKTLLTVRCKFIVPDPGTVLG